MTLAYLSWWTVECVSLYLWWSGRPSVSFLPSAGKEEGPGVMLEWKGRLPPHSGEEAEQTTDWGEPIASPWGGPPSFLLTDHCSKALVLLFRGRPLPVLLLSAGGHCSCFFAHTERSMARLAYLTSLTDHDNLDWYLVIGCLRAPSYFKSVICLQRATPFLKSNSLFWNSLRLTRRCKVVQEFSSALHSIQCTEATAKVRKLTLIQYH